MPRWRKHPCASGHLRGMKTMTCKELGGPCGEALSAANWEEMVENMTQHVIDHHPGTAKEMEELHNEDTKQWSREMRPKWDAKPHYISG